MRNKEVLQLESLDTRLDRLEHLLVRDTRLLNTPFDGPAPSAEFIELIATAHELANVEGRQPTGRRPSEPADKRSRKASVDHFKGGLN